jgi:phosphopantothenoylcysteine decarboxylase / phosphopantothenate---cysteine ligase
VSGPGRGVSGRRVLLGVSGGIAAYKAIQLARDLTLGGADVDVVLTEGALDFVRPLSFEALTGRPAHVAGYLPGDPLLHIRLAREAEVAVVAPATANFIARAAAGMGDDLLTTTLLATAAPILVCPAMNDRMYAHPATRRNLRMLRELGYEIVGPASGPLAWGEGEGPGRLSDPAEILHRIGLSLAPAGWLRGRRVLVTAGPTREPIDPVRYVGNRSSGRMGFALASAAARRGAEVNLVSGPTAIDPPIGVTTTRVETAEEMREAVARALPDSDVLIMAAAVADFRPDHPVAVKLKKEEGGVPEITLERAPDVLLSTRDLRPPGCLVVGFALETGSAVESGRSKLEAKGLDLLVVNDAKEPGAGFEVFTNRVTILDRTGSEESLPLLDKYEVAERILDRIESLMEAEAR